MSVLWNKLLVNPIFNVLVIFYGITGGNMGIAIILLTLVIRLLLIPVVLPSMKSMQKQRELQPELEKIKNKYKYDKQKQAEEQMKLFKKHGLNPASGCLNQILMIIVLIALYNVITKFSFASDINSINEVLYFAKLKFAEGTTLNTKFLYMDLTKPDPYYLIPVLGGVFQFFASKMMQPYVEKGEEAAKKTPDKSDDLAYNMQEQMLYLMPLMTVMIGLKLPAGAALYILTTTIFSVVQQYFLSGLGGLKPLLAKLNLSARK